MMEKPARNIWLITNAASGSNDADALETLVQACTDNGLPLRRRSLFPADPLPSPEELDAAEIAVLAIFAGDGTVNTVLGQMAGWGGAVLVLPGGTMNLLYHRLFGELTLEQALAAVSSGAAAAIRPSMIRTPLGDAYAEAMAGPGTAWSNVREAMRDGNLIDLATGTGAAVAQTVAGDMIACIDPAVGKPEGYPLLMVAAQGDCLHLIAYHAQTPGEFLEQAAALAARDFRRGPHEVLASGDAFALRAPMGEGFGVLLDGEQAQASGSARFSLARCEVDLLAIRTDG